MCSQRNEMQNVVKNLTAAKAPKRDGKGFRYVDMINHQVALYGAMVVVTKRERVLEESCPFNCIFQKGRGKRVRKKNLPVIFYLQNRTYVCIMNV